MSSLLRQAVSFVLRCLKARKLCERVKRFGRRDGGGEGGQHATTEAVRDGDHPAHFQQIPAGRGATQTQLSRTNCHVIRC